MPAITRNATPTKGNQPAPGNHVAAGVAAKGRQKAAPKGRAAAVKGIGAGKGKTAPSRATKVTIQ